ncbi:MAG: restriction endonuclease subunit S [Bacteroidales bacterium]|nr:restriction endonuclease subunit S [Bacteroidales bacterium]
MNRIDISGWKKYGVEDLFFDIERGKLPPVSKLSEGKTAVVTAYGKNQGVALWADVEPSYENAITVSMNGALCGYFAYHDYAFAANPDCGVLKPKFELSKYAARYLCAVLNRVGAKYFFGEKITWDKLRRETIALPTTSDGTPDWDYMEQYIKEREEKVLQFVNVLNNRVKKKSKRRVSYWHGNSFKVGIIFAEIIKPYVIHAKSVIESPYGIPYVVRSKFNNGIKCRIAIQPEYKPSPAGTISFGAENAAFFYQPEPYVSGRDIYYIDTTHLSKYACLFIASSLQTITHKYSYNNGLFPDLLREEIITLPSTPDGNPDWDYMDAYMRHIESQQILSALQHFYHRE